MIKTNTMEVFEKAPVPKAVLKNAIPAMAAMLMVLIYNLADTFFIGQTHNDILVAAVSLATPVFLIFMAVGTVFGIGGTSVPCLWTGTARVRKKGVCFLSVELYGGRVCDVCRIPAFYGADSDLDRSQHGHLGTGKNLLNYRCLGRSFRSDLQLLL